MPFDFPFVFKFNWGGEGDTVFLIKSPGAFEEILQKAIEKAKKNGFEWNYWIGWYFDLGNDGGIESKIY